MRNRSSQQKLFTRRVAVQRKGEMEPGGGGASKRRGWTRPWSEVLGQVQEQGPPLVRWEERRPQARVCMDQINVSSWGQAVEVGDTGISPCETGNKVFSRNGWERIEVEGHA